jgi:hypothetical protein
MRYLSLSEVFELHDRIISSTGVSVAFAIVMLWNLPLTNLAKHLIKKTFTLILFRKQPLYVFHWL